MIQLPDPVADVRCVTNILHGKRGKDGADWFVPEHWNDAGYTDGTTDPDRPGELRVDPYDFFAVRIEKALRERDTGIFPVPRSACRLYTAVIPPEHFSSMRGVLSATTEIRLLPVTS
jgi:hypothetical protein